MYEKVNPMHPDKIADRIAGAIVDLVYAKSDYPKIAVEVLIGHDECFIIIEGNIIPLEEDMDEVVHRITQSDSVKTHYQIVPQDEHLADNQIGAIRCGDNGIFKGILRSSEEKLMTYKAKDLYERYKTDGKYILDERNKKYIICQSCCDAKIQEMFKDEIKEGYVVVVNPLGHWTGGINVDSGATNRKLGSDMGRAVTGGGLHGKDLSKADVSLNIYAYLLAELTGGEVEICCAIGDENVTVFLDGVKAREIPYMEAVATARNYINLIGGFEKFAEWGLIR